MNPRFHVLSAAVTAVLLVTGTAPLRAPWGLPVVQAPCGLAVMQAQSLADVAREEEARRREVKQPSKVYTNKDLGSAPAPPAPAPPPAGAANPNAGSSAALKDTKAGGDAAAKGPLERPAPGEPATGAPKEKPKDQAYWSGRMTALLSQLDQDATFSEALQSRINALTADFSARDDPAQRDIIARDRQKSVDPTPPRRAYK